jgi:spore germination cell wall hydrolase CwlJ-like protein
MDARSYNDLSDLQLCSLCVWREARGEGLLGKRGVAHVIKNRSDNPGWWGHTVSSVILCPWQFSSFNPSDPNADKWPADNDPSYSDSLTVSEDVLVNGDEDITNGATSYFDTSIPPPAWTDNMTLTLSVGRLRFYKENV